MARQTAVEWLHSQWANEKLWSWEKIESWFEQAKQMEIDRRKEDFKIAYNYGYLDARCNHINDADNLANEIEYLKSKIDNIDDEIKRREEKIASLLINGDKDYDITDYIISPFGTPEKK